MYSKSHIYIHDKHKQFTAMRHEKLIKCTVMGYGNEYSVKA